MQQPEPYRNDQRVVPYSSYPRREQPVVWCGGCSQRMRPSSDARYPHEYRCPGNCGGYVDVMPPTWRSERRCGGQRQGLRCNRPLADNQIVCVECILDEGRNLLSSPWRHTADPAHPHPLIQLAGRALAAEEAQRQHDEAERELLAAKQDHKDQLAAARADTASNVVYYVRLGHNHIKIGTTGDLPRRMNELRCVNPANLLAAEPGAHTLEKERHTQFRKWRYSVRREDFAEAPELLEHIAAVRAEHGDPYAVAAQLVQRQKNQ